MSVIGIPDLKKLIRGVAWSPRRDLSAREFLDGTQSESLRVIGPNRFLILDMPLKYLPIVRCSEDREYFCFAALLNPESVESWEVGEVAAALRLTMHDGSHMFLVGSSLKRPEKKA